MAFTKNRRWRLSPREEREGINRAHDFYAGAMPPDKAAEYRERFITKLKPKRVRRPVDGRVVVPTEHQEQALVIGWWGHKHKQYSVPHFALFAVPNGGMRDFITGSRLKAEGVRKGSPDLILDCARGGYHGLRIEMKRVDATESDKKDEQKAFGHYLESSGYRFHFCNGADAAIAAIEAYMELP